MKDVYYFSHDSSARRDPKMVALMSKYGIEGYGVFFVLIEIMSEQHGYKIEKFPKMSACMAKEMCMTEERFNDIFGYILTECELLKQDDKYIWSDSLFRRKEIQEAKRLVKVEAGRVGGNRSAEVRWGCKQNVSTISDSPNEIVSKSKHPVSSLVSKITKVKESKVKERKENNMEFGPPFIGEVIDYCKERKNNVDAHKWHNFYSSKGWLIGKNKMKDWKAAVRTWESRENPTTALTGPLKAPLSIVDQDILRTQQLKALKAEEKLNGIK